MSSQSRDSTPIYTIDAFDRLVEANRAFASAFAPAVGEELSTLIGRSIWDFVPGIIARQLWHITYQRVRVEGVPTFMPLRADTATERCLIDLELHPVADSSIQHVRERVWVEQRPAIALLDPNYPRDARTLRRCHWCARVQVRLGDWQEIEDAQATLGIEAGPTLPVVSECVCAACTQSVLKVFPARAA